MARERIELLNQIAAGGERRLRRRRGLVMAGVGAVVLLVVAGGLVATGGRHDKQRLLVTTGGHKAATPPPARPFDAGASTTTSPSAIPSQIDGPPPVTITGDRTFALAPWSYCWSSLASGVCSDGRPPKDPPEVNNSPQLFVVFPITGWNFTARFVAVGGGCRREQVVPLEPRDATTFALHPYGYAGDYDVTLSGRGLAMGTAGGGSGPAHDHGGDLAVTFRWRNMKAGPLAEPAATASILAGSDGAPVSHGVEVTLQNMRTTPANATAQVEVVPTTGSPTVLSLSRRQDGCVLEGTVRFTGDRVDAIAAVRPGNGPYHYVVTVDMDGRSYHGRATWPADVNPECSSCVPLQFEPPLPALIPRP